MMYRLKVEHLILTCRFPIELLDRQILPASRIPIVLTTYSSLELKPHHYNPVADKVSKIHLKTPSRCNQIPFQFPSVARHRDRRFLQGFPGDL